MDHTIVEYSPIFKDQVIELILNIQQKEFGIPISIQSQQDLLSIESIYQKDNGNFWIAIYNKEVVGTIGLIKFAEDMGALRKMFVHKNFRGKQAGIANQLLQALIIHAKNQGMKSIYLGTLERFKAAHRFYEKNGFTRINQDDLPLEYPAMKIDTIFYALNIT